MFVAYALGNFVFDQAWSLETQQGALLEVTESRPDDPPGTGPKVP